MDNGPSRRTMLTALGASIPLAGCTESLSGDEEENESGEENDSTETATENGTNETDEEESEETETETTETENESDGNETVDNESDGGGNETETNETDGNETETNETDGDETDEGASDAELPRWPAIEYGEVVSDFESLGDWVVHTGVPEAASEEARTGSQAIAVESEDDAAVMAMGFPDGIDLENWTLSMAIKAESARRVVMEVIAPERGTHLTANRIVPEGLDDWFRVDFGYTSKHGTPDLTNVTELRLTVFGPEDGPTRFVADDLRRTQTPDNGKAILAFYGGIESHREVAIPNLAEREWPAALPIDPRAIGSSGRMGVEELTELRDRGWDVCSHPANAGALPERPPEQQRDIIENGQEFLADQGFEDGARHFFAPDDRMGRETVEIVRDVHESGFLFGYNPTAAPPTGIHTVSTFWGMALHDGVRRQINLADQYNQLVVIRVPRIVADDAAEDASGEFMPVSDFEELVNHIEQRGLDVVTPSALVDGGIDAGDGDSESSETPEREEGTLLEAGPSHEFEGSGSGSTGEFDLQSGIALASFEHGGSGEFVVEVQGELPNELVVSTAGTGSGESAFAVGGGSYTLEVEADGDWTIEIEQPEVHSDDLAELPTEASGSGSSYIGPLWTEGGVSLQATHDGSGEFIVDGYDTEGNWEQVIYDEGEFDNNRSYSAGGAVWLNVEADGDWTISIE